MEESQTLKIKKFLHITFDKIKFDLSKYISQTITYPKIQETPSRDLFNCIYYTYINRENKYDLKQIF